MNKKNTSSSAYSREMISRLKSVRKELGKKVCILGHYYQNDVIVEMADFVGDSLKLCKEAAEQKQCEYIVFCGVRFMAESAVVLVQKNQRVIHPTPKASCPMADMVNIHDLEKFWKTFQNDRIMPICYINSSIEVKSFVGRHNGIICTSSNATKIMRKAINQSEQLLFVPDRNLGKNTAIQCNLKEDNLAIWNPNDVTETMIDKCRRSKVVLWDGYCHVHQDISVTDIVNARNKVKDALVVVHPECPSEVVNKADANGSTEFICKYIAEAPAGRTIFVGTESNLVLRLKARYSDRKVLELKPSKCLTMAEITPELLLATLENIGKIEPVKIKAEDAHFARLAFDRMLSF